MESIISEPSKGVWFASSVKLLLKTPIVQRLVRTIFRGSILPLKSMFDNVKNAADDVPVIGTGDTVRAGKERADPFHLAFGKVKQGTHATPPCLQYTLFSLHWE